MKSNRMWILALVAILALLGTAGATATGSPESTALNYFNYQGLLLDPGSGEPVADGAYTLTFTLYDHATSTNPANKMWEQTQNVTVQDGLFNVLLGDLGASTWVDGRDLWLGITVAGESEMVPRQQLVSVPYALYADQVGPHDHLGQTWSGTDDPLIVGGSFSGSNRAPLVLSNSYTDGDGLRVASAGRYGLYVGGADYGLNVASANQDGVYVTSATGDGFSVASAGDDGLYVYSVTDDGVHVQMAGSPSTVQASAGHNGFEVAGAEGNGFYVGQADSSGVVVNKAGAYGLYVGQADSNGVYVNTVDGDGVRVNLALGDGVHVEAAGGYAGYFDGDLKVTGELDTDQALIGELEVTGPAIGFFPRPAYDSGWVAIAQVEGKWLTHNVGGNPDDYFIDMQCQDSTYGINNQAYGGDMVNSHAYGAYYNSATGSHIWVFREPEDTRCDMIRVRIWYIQ
jgi:hypothetical protein